MKEIYVDQPTIKLIIGRKKFYLDKDFILVDEEPKLEGENYIYKLKAISKRLEDILYGNSNI